MKKRKDMFAQRVYEIGLFVLGVFIIALAYNTLIIPNNIIIGGTTGLSVILNKIFGWDINFLILVFGVILLFISFMFLGVKKTKKNIVGTFLYPTMLYFTAPLAKTIIPSLHFHDYIVIVMLGGTFLGLGFGFVYKAGYTTGGIDIVMQILNKYLKIPEGKASKITNLFIVLISLPIIGVTSVVYSAIILFYEEIVTNKITIGISDSKLFLVYTRKIDGVRDALVRNGDIGFTIIPTEGGYSHYKGEMLMCVVSTNDYYAFKELVLSIDPNAFFVINDIYEVNGGYKKQHLPFL